MKDSLITDLKIIQNTNFSDFNKKEIRLKLLSYVTYLRLNGTREQRTLISSAIESKTKFGCFNMVSQLLVSLGEK